MTGSMFKLVTLLKRQREITPQRFQSEWRDHRGAMFARHQQIRRYVQSHPLLPLAYRQGEPACDGLEELWFDSETSAHEYYDATINVYRDDEKFLDKSTVTMAVREVTLVDGAPTPGAIKNVVITDRMAGMSRPAFSDYWQHKHPLVANRLPGLQRYEQNHVQALQWLNDSHDGLSLVWFDSVEAIKAVTQTPEFALTMQDERNFLKHAGHLPIVLTNEYVIFER